MTVLADQRRSFWLGLAAILLQLVLLCAPAAANNNFSATPPIGGTQISGVSGALTSTTVGATSQTGEPVTIGGGTVNSMWYTWTAPASGRVTFETCSNTQTVVDTVIAGYTGNAVNALTQLAINDDTTGCATTTQPNYGSRISFNVTQGTVYHVQVDGYASNNGAFRLAWSFAGFSISKSASAASVSATGPITYTISVQNIGAVALSGLSITDTLLLGAAARTLTSGPTLTGGDTNSNGQIDSTETFVYTATYNVTQADITAGGTFSNTATYATTQAPAQTSNAATTVIVQTPNFSISKTQSGGPSPLTAAGQTVTYTISVQNTGNIPLAGPALSENLLMGVAARTLSSGPTLTGGDGGTAGVLDVGETWTYSASYVVTQADFDAGSGNLSNTATFSTTLVAAKSSTATTTISRTPGLLVVKSWTFATPGGDANSNGVADAGDVITYSFQVTNSGNTTLTNITVSETFLGQGPPPVPGSETLITDVAPVGNSTDATGGNGIWSVLGVGDTIRFRANYTVTQGDIDNG